MVVTVCYKIILVSLTEVLDCYINSQALKTLVNDGLDSPFILMFENMNSNTIKVCFVAEDCKHIFDLRFVVKIPDDEALDVMHLVLLGILSAISL